MYQLSSVAHLVEHMPYAKAESLPRQSEASVSPLPFLYLSCCDCLNEADMPKKPLKSLTNHVTARLSHASITEPIHPQKYFELNAHVSILPCLLSKA